MGETGSYSCEDERRGVALMRKARYTEGRERDIIDNYETRQVYMSKLIGQRERLVTLIQQKETNGEDSLSVDEVKFVMEVR